MHWLHLYFVLRSLARGTSLNIDICGETVLGKAVYVSIIVERWCWGRQSKRPEMMIIERLKRTVCVMSQLLGRGRSKKRSDEPNTEAKNGLQSAG